MGRRTDKKSQNQHWQQFVLDNLHRKNITADDIADDSQPYPDIDGKDYETAVATLKRYLSPSGWKRLSDRFRQFKARRISQKTTITLRQETLAKLREAGRLAGTDDYDMLVEFLLDPEEDLEPTRQHVSDLDSGLTVEQATRIMLTKLSLRKSTRKTVLNAIQQAYEAGWKDGKAHKSKRESSSAALDAAASVYMDAIKAL